MSGSLNEDLDLFGLDLNCNAGEASRQYNRVTQHIHKQNISHTVRCEILQRIDIAYIAVTEHLIRQGQAVSAPPLSISEIMLRTWESNPRGRDQPIEMAARTLRSGVSNDELCKIVAGARSDEILRERHDIEFDVAMANTNPAPSNYTIKVGDIFSEVPDGGVIVHSTNCMGIWGHGFAQALRDKYPAAFKTFEEFCSDESPADLIGTCLIIPPHAKDYLSSDDTVASPAHYIVCLFTSIGYGRPNRKGLVIKRDSGHALVNLGRDAPHEILNSTNNALLELFKDLAEYDSAKHTMPYPRPGNLYSPQINSGAFKVPWSDTEVVIKNVFGSSGRDWTVFIKPS